MNGTIKKEMKYVENGNEKIQNRSASTTGSKVQWRGKKKYIIEGKPRTNGVAFMMKKKLRGRAT